jgi:Uma2 family endonuclease
MIREMSTETIAKKLFTVDEFRRMGEAGILSEQSRFELIRGEVVEMPIGDSAHGGRVKRIVRVFTSRLGESAIVSVQDALWIEQHSLPMPDVTLLKPRADFYTESHPRPEDVFLVVEVSRTTVWYDGEIKAPLYAAAGIQEYWQLDINKEVLIVRTDPANDEYRSEQTIQRAETVALKKLPVYKFTIDEFLGYPSAPPVFS